MTLKSKILNDNLPGWDQLLDFKRKKHLNQTNHISKPFRKCLNAEGMGYDLLSFVTISHDLVWFVWYIQRYI